MVIELPVQSSPSRSPSPYIPEQLLGSYCLFSGDVKRLSANGSLEMLSASIANFASAAAA